MLEEDCEERDVTCIQACMFAEDREEWKKWCLGRRSVLRSSKGFRSSQDNTEYART